MNRHNLPFARHAATDMSAIGWVMIAYRSNCLISPGWLASTEEGDSIINATLLYHTIKKRKLRHKKACAISYIVTGTFKITELLCKDFYSFFKTNCSYKQM